MKSILRSLALICLFGLGSALRAYTGDITNFAIGSAGGLNIYLDSPEPIDVTFEVIDNSTGQPVARITVMAGGPYWAAYHQWFSEDYASGLSGYYSYVGYGPSFYWNVAGIAPGNYTLRYTYPDGFDSGYNYSPGTWGAYVSGQVYPY